MLGNQPLRGGVGMQTTVINPGNSGYWDVAEDGRLIVAVTSLPGLIFTSARWPFAFNPGEYEFDVMHEVGGRSPIMAYPRMRVREPQFMMLRPRDWYEDIFSRLNELNLKGFFEVEPAMAEWKPSDRSRFQPTYNVYGAVTMDQETLVTLRMLISD